MSGANVKHEKDHEEKITSIRTRLAEIENTRSAATQEFLSEYNELWRQLHATESEEIRFRYEQAALKERNECADYLSKISLRKINNGKAISIGARIAGWKVRFGDKSAWFIRLDTGEVEGPWPNILGIVGVLRGKWSHYVQYEKNLDAKASLERLGFDLVNTKVSLLGSIRTEDAIREIGSVYGVEISGEPLFFVACDRDMIVTRRFGTVDDATACVKNLWRIDNEYRPFYRPTKSLFYGLAEDSDDGLEQDLRPD